MTEKLLAAIDAFLGTTSGRSLVSSDEVADFALDLRSIVSAGDEGVERPECRVCGSVYQVIGENGPGDYCPGCGSEQTAEEPEPVPA